MYLVTGSTGFIGSQLCRALVARGERVRAFHRPNSPLTLLADMPVEHTLGDLTRPETLEAAVQGVEVIFHAAAQLGARGNAGMQAVTVEGTRHLLAAARRAGVMRVVHTSSVAALGVPVHIHGAEQRLVDETHSWNFPPEWWQYGYTKHLAEMEVQRAVAQGLDVVITNPAVVVGAGDLNRVAGNVLLMAASGRVPVSIEGGLNVIHIADVVAGHLAALERGRTGERYILASENMPHTHFLRLIAEVSGARPPRIILPGTLVRRLSTLVAVLQRWLPLPMAAEAVHKAGVYFYYDNQKARTALGFTPQRTALEAIEEAYLWYRANPSDQGS